MGVGRRWRAQLRRRARAGTGTGTARGTRRCLPPRGSAGPGCNLTLTLSSLPSAAPPPHPGANKMMQSSALAAEGAVKGLPEILGVPVQRKDAFSLFLPSLPCRKGGPGPAGQGGQGLEGQRPADWTGASHSRPGVWIFPPPF